MKINIFYKNITADKPLELFIEEKIGGLEKYLNGSADARVEIGLPSKHHRSGPVFYAEVNIKMGGRLLRAEAQNKDLRTAVLDVKEELQRQIKDFKEKSNDLSRKSTK